MPGMSDGIDLDGPRKLRSQTRSHSVEKSSPFSDARKSIRQFFHSDKKISKRKRSAATVASRNGDMNSNGAHGEQDLKSLFKSKFEESALQRSGYDKERHALVQDEESKSWDHDATITASKTERKANTTLLKIREHERENLFGNKASEAIPGPETLDMGGQFLTNRQRIVDESRVFTIAQRMPKGAHLHIHFNSEFLPEVLLEQAEHFVPDTLFIRSTLPLINDLDLYETEMVFNVVPKETRSADIFSKTYNSAFKNTDNIPWMKWSTFCDAFRAKFNKDPKEWIQSKMVLDEEETYGIRQTTNGIWARFNQGTRCFKGLMNYGSIYRWYIQKLIDSMIKDGIMYAELRPMLMDKSIPTDDGKGTLSNTEQMRIILEEWEAKKKKLEKEGRLRKFPFGVKIIYCTPRSIPKEKMASELEDCIRLKQEFPDLICGFDLVGAEDRPNYIGFYKDELIAFREACKALDLTIPFMFHAGETLLDRGGSRNPANSNLYDSFLLDAKRIGHGFSLVKHPELAAKFKEREICIELCPTSNELLHLCRNIKEHPFPELLAAGIPCTVNSDNPSLFRGIVRDSSSLSLEFYQVMVGSPMMNLHGWKQLALWSLKYSCLNDEQKATAKEYFMKDWEEFCEWVVQEYGEYADGLGIDL